MTQANNQTPVNFVTGKAYQGDKATLLTEAAISKGYKSNEWATMNQWNQCKRSIARGQNGIAITYKRILESDNGPVEDTVTTHVYNRDQLARVTTM